MSQIKLREYQHNYNKHTLDFFDFKQYLMLVMPTGTGKTTVFSSLVSHWLSQGYRTFIVVHRIELVDQIVQRLKSFGITAGILAGKYPVNLELPVQVGMIQSFDSSINWYPDFVVIDECHHSVAASYSQLWEKFKKSKILGVTATPVRLDGKGFSDIYEEMLNLYPLSYFFDNNYLVRPLHYFCSNIDPRYLRVMSGDYSLSEQSRFLIGERAINNVVQVYQQYSPGKKGVVFAVNVEHSKMLVKRFNELGIKAAHLCGKVPDAERYDIVEKFKAGEYSILCNYDIVSEGFDVPDIDTVLLARRTKSLSTYIQSVGRCLRPDEKNGKKYGYVLDCAGQWLEFGFAGLDYPWSLDMNGEIVLETMERQKVFYKTSKGKVKPIYEDPNELIGHNLVAVDQDLIRIGHFEKYLYELEPNLDLVGPAEAVEALYKFSDWMDLLGYKWKEVEVKYIERSLQKYGTSIPKEMESHILNNTLC